MQTHRFALPVLACIALGASCASARLASWLPAVGIAGRARLHRGASSRCAVDARVVATWGGGPPLPPPASRAAAGRTRLSWRDDIRPDCSRADACTWERRARALATRAELARLRSSR